MAAPIESLKKSVTLLSSNNELITNSNEWVRSVHGCARRFEPQLCNLVSDISLDRLQVNIILGLGYHTQSCNKVSINHKKCVTFLTYLNRQFIETVSTGKGDIR